MADEFKVVGIGFNRTGTTTLRRCLQILGIEPHPDRFAMNDAGLVSALKSNNDTERCLQFAADYRGFEDQPWNMGTLYQDFAGRYPGTRFILTIRDSESWWNSVSWGQAPGYHAKISRLFGKHLGVEEVTREGCIGAYERFNQSRIEYFEAHPEQHFLIMNYQQGDGWEKLCTFLDKPIPRIRFPHVNRSDQMHTLRAKLRKNMPVPARKIVSRSKTRLQSYIYAWRR